MYDIRPISELDTIDFSILKQTSKETVRKNIDETKFIIEYIDENLGVYSHAEMLAIVQLEEWNKPIII